MRKRLKRSNALSSCSSPYCNHPASLSAFSWHEEDIWTYIARFLDGKSLVMLALTNKWFLSIIMHDSVWKFACMRDLQVPDPGSVAFQWFKIYAYAFDGSHSFEFRQQDRHLDWMRIGAFFFNSPDALLTDKLNIPVKILKGKTIEKVLEACGSCLLRNIKPGIWIADMQLVRCPACNLDSCEGTMQMLDARHIELFLSEGFKNGSWKYEIIGTHKMETNTQGACGAIFDLKHIKDSQTAGVFNLKAWIGKPDDLQPKAIIAYHGVAVNTNLQKNDEYCETSFCGNDDVPIRFPFQVERKQSGNCSVPGFRIGCNIHGKTILNLPNSGQFFVREINYISQQISLYDPDNCLPGRLQSLNLSGSPFSVSFYHNYTFLSCPAQLTKSRYAAIDCLSNSTTSVLATISMSLVNSMTPSCQIISTLPVPVSWPVQYDEGFSNDLNNDLQLTWYESDCIDCESRGGVCGLKSSNSQEIGCFYNSKSGQSNYNLLVFRILCLSIAIPALAFAAGIGFCACFMDSNRPRFTRQPRNTIPVAVTPQPTIIVMGLDESTIESYQKVVLGESKRLPGPNGSTCSICLSEYCSKETIRCIPECKHCFHADCIDEWLRMNSSCPLCRNSPAPSPARASSHNT
ncbi:hypothetical protein Dsin_025938 [Dipteronia sinensis]|uniref:non-specific serine/threonine protein kinase n=1 Tax=Dipteronia sinensis TaxID=43782 RepID=A0AAE0DXK8_9ROSI|nr:hypothetical protein Dsin_025938 [Dipteronia sinensis]